MAASSCSCILGPGYHACEHHDAHCHEPPGRQKRGEWPPTASEGSRIEYPDGPRCYRPRAEQNTGHPDELLDGATARRSAYDACTQGGYSQTDQDPAHKTKPSDDDLIRLNHT